MQEIAIVGAGAAGACAAYALRDAAAVTVFEKSRGVCGRAATRRHRGCHYDYGANYLRDDDPRVERLVTEVLDTDGLVEVREPIYTFDADGTIAEGRDGDGHRWSYRAGITQFAKRLFARTDARVELETRVGRLARASEDWRVLDDDRDHLGTFDAVVLTPPAPQTAALLDATAWDHPVRTDLQAAVEAVEYRPVYSALLHYPFEVELPYYALINTDRDHALGWLSREECKPGHVPDGESLLVAQMGPDWSRRRYDDDPDDVVADATSVVADLLDDDRLRDPDWTDHQGWRYALPEEGIAAGACDRASEYDLHFAGDWVAGEGRIHAAARTGLDVGQALADEL
jgi:predicted NAD/FAD-dependent oxidoreductase